MLFTEITLEEIVKRVKIGCHRETRLDSGKG